MAPPSRMVRLSASSLAIMLDAHDMGEPHVTLLDEPMWYPPEERREVVAQAWSEFAEQGLTDTDGGLRESVLGWLPALSRGAVEYYGWTTVDDVTTSFLVVPLGGHAVLAARRDDEVHVDDADGRAPAEALVGNLPPAKKPRTGSLNVSRAALAGRRGPDSIMVGGRGNPDVARVRKFAARPAEGLGELYVTVRDQFGSTHTVAEPLRYRDVDGERWMIKLDGEHLSLVPGTASLFVDELYAMRDAVRCATADQ